MLGVVTIGMSPRADLQKAFGEKVPGAYVRVRGALDGLEPHEVEDLSRRRTEYPLLVKLRDGSTREIGIEWLHPLVERIAQELAEEHARVVVVACAGEFPACRCDVPVILPGRELPREVARVAERRRVGVVTPVERQAPAAASKWLADGFDPVVTWASPWKHSEITRASTFMRDADVDAVVLDCMGHDMAYADQFAKRCGKLVFTAQDVAASAAAAAMR